MAHEETLAVRLQLIALCNEQNCVSDIQTFEVSDMWTCDQENFTLDCEGKDSNQIYMCVYIYVCECVCVCMYVCTYIYIYTLVPRLTKIIRSGITFFSRNLR